MSGGERVCTPCWFGRGEGVQHECVSEKCPCPEHHLTPPTEGRSDERGRHE